MLAKTAQRSAVLRSRSGIVAPRQLGQQRSLTTTRVQIKDGPSAEGAARVVIVGGGFGGLYTAVRLSQLFWPQGKTPQVTLIDQSDRFVFKPLLYELLNGGATEGEVAPSFGQLLAPYPVRFIQGKVLGGEIGETLKDGGSVSGGKVLLEGGNELPYDWLVLALGSSADPRGVPGVREHAVPFNNLDDALRVRGALEEIEGAAQSGWTSTGPDARPLTVMVVGAGYAGVELAAVVAERLRNNAGGAVRVQVVTPSAGILPGSPPGQREAAERTLGSLGVETLAGTRVLSLERSSEPGTLSTSVVAQLSTSAPEGSDAGATTVTCGADLVLWTAGSAPATRTAASRFPLPANERGALLTDATLRVRGHARVFALGDVCVSDSGYAAGTATQGTLPATAQVAFQQADYAAWNMWAAMMGRPLLPFRYQHLGSMMALGATNAAIALPFELPRPLQTTLQASPLGPLLEAVGVRLVAPKADEGSAAGVVLEGPLGALVRRAAYLYRQPTGEQRVSVATEWLAQAATFASQAAATGFPGGSRPGGTSV